MTRAALVLLALFFPATLAHADAIPPPPDDCARGAVGRSSHTDVYCDPTTCTADADCGPGMACSAGVGLCVEPRTRTPGGRFPTGVEVGPVTYDVAHASCTTDADCGAGNHCVTASRCTSTAAPPPAAPAHATESSGGGCHAGRGRSAPLAAAMLLGLFALLGRRRG